MDLGWSRAWQGLWGGIEGRRSTGVAGEGVHVFRCQARSECWQGSAWTQVSSSSLKQQGPGDGDSTLECCCAGGCQWLGVHRAGPPPRSTGCFPTRQLAVCNNPRAPDRYYYLLTITKLIMAAIISLRHFPGRAHIQNSHLQSLTCIAYRTPRTAEHQPTAVQSRFGPGAARSAVSCSPGRIAIGEATRSGRMEAQRTCDSASRPSPREEAMRR